MSTGERRAILETFPNPHPGRSYLVEHQTREFTSLCPKTGQPDFGTIRLRYEPGGTCVELKSLKFYLQSYRNDGIFYEDVTNRILDDLVAGLNPVWIEVRSTWTMRGGLQSAVTAEHGSRSFRASEQPR